MTNKFNLDLSDHAGLKQYYKLYYEENKSRKKQNSKINYARADEQKKSRKIEQGKRRYLIKKEFLRLAKIDNIFV